MVLVAKTPQHHALYRRPTEVQRDDVIVGISQAICILNLANIEFCDPERQSCFVNRRQSVLETFAILVFAVLLFDSNTRKKFKLG